MRVAKMLIQMLEYAAGGAVVGFILGVCYNVLAVFL